MMDGRILGTLIKDDLDNLSSADRKQEAKVWEAIGDRIIRYIKEHGEVIVAPNIPVNILTQRTSGEGQGTIQ